MDSGPLPSAPIEEAADWSLQAQVEKLSPAKGDVIVLRYPDPMPHKHMERISDRARIAFPDNQVVVLDSGAEIGWLVGLTPSDYREMRDAVKALTTVRLSDQTSKASQ